MWKSLLILLPPCGRARKYCGHQHSGHCALRLKSKDTKRWLQELFSRTRVVFTDVKEIRRGVLQQSWKAQ